jgi:hypothetical protein
MTAVTATQTRRRLVTRIGAGLATAGAAIALSLGGATAASAQTYGAAFLTPSNGVCGPSQYASFQVRADGSATAQGAKFKLLKNGVVVLNTPNRANTWVAELRTSYGNFPGPGYYSICVQNTGTANTNVTYQLRTDYEF